MSIGSLSSQIFIFYIGRYSVALFSFYVVDRIRTFSKVHTVVQYIFLSLVQEDYIYKCVRAVHYRVSHFM